LEEAKATRRDQQMANIVDVSLALPTRRATNC